MTSATIQEIEGIDDYWGPAFRSVYEGEGGHEAFVQQLDERIKQHDKEIEKLCNFHYQGFIESIRELLKVRSRAEELHAKVSAVDTNVKETTDSLCSKAEELIRARRVELNIAATIEKMELCLPLLTTYSKLKTQVEAKRYYPALKTLEQLEQVLLPRVGAGSWRAPIAASVPRLRAAVRAAAMADLRTFLEAVRARSVQVGAMAMKQTQDMLGRSLATIVKNKKEMAAGAEGGPQCPHELIDFSTLHRCLHIHSVLGAKQEFIQYYRAQRAQQARLAVPAGGAGGAGAGAGGADGAAGVRAQLCAVLGSLLVELRLQAAGDGLVSRDWALAAGGAAVRALAAALRAHTALLTDPTELLAVKHHIVLFIHTLKWYGLPVEPLPQLLHEMAEHYTEVLMQRWVAIFRDILDNASFVPIQVENQEQYDAVMDTFPYDGDELEAQPFPRAFPFTGLVPAVYVQVKEFLYAWLKYSAGLGLGGARRASQARRSAALLLARSFCGCLSALFRRPLPLAQLAQIMVDTKYLEDATAYLYEFIANITGAELAVPPNTGSMFQAARDDAEQTICENLERKIDEFLDLENYDWLLGEPTGQASAFVADMLSYLGGVLAALAALPARVRSAAIKAAVARIATRLYNLLVDGTVRAISLGALHQLDLDVIQCEQFVGREPLDGELQQHFQQLRQLLDLVTGWEWPAYLHAAARGGGGRFARVPPRAAAAVLDKLRDAGPGGAGVFSVLRKHERDRRKLLDTVLRQLRQLAAAQEP